MVAQAFLAVALVYARSIEVVYLLAGLITLVRLYVIAARLPLLTHLSVWTKYMMANTALCSLRLEARTAARLREVVEKGLWLPEITLKRTFFQEIKPYERSVGTTQPVA